MTPGTRPPSRRLRMLLVCVTPLLSCGCIAAVIPIATGAAAIKRQADLDSAAARSERTAQASARSDLTVIPTELAPTPAPAAAIRIGDPAIPAFRSYALAQAQAPGGAGRRTSAILSSASDLRVQQADCAASQLAVFIDLDPGRETFDPLAPGDSDPALGAALADLRDQGVTVIWFSRLGANFSSAARAALVESRLDPTGRDTLMLLRDLGERKQSLRDEVAGRYCPIAMLGDERADFDELYLYLRNPDTALPLDAMIGKGWFLASPFVSGSTPQQGTTP